METKTYLNNEKLTAIEEGLDFSKIGALEKADMNKDYYLKQIETFMNIVDAHTANINFKDKNKDDIINAFITYMRCRYIAKGMTLADQVILINNIETIFGEFMKWVYSYGNQKKVFYDTLSDGIENYMMSDITDKNKIDDFLSIDAIIPEETSSKEKEVGKTIATLPVPTNIVDVNPEDIVEVKDKTERELTNIEKEVGLSFEKASEILEKAEPEYEKIVNEIIAEVKQFNQLELLSKLGDLAKVLLDHDSLLYKDIRALFNKVFENTSIDKQETYDKLDDIIINEIAAGKTPNFEDFINLSDLKIEDYIQIINNIKNNNVIEFVSTMITNVAYSFFGDCNGNKDLMDKIGKLITMIKENSIEIVKSLFLTDVAKGCTEEELNKPISKKVETVKVESEAALKTAPSNIINHQNIQPQQPPIIHQHFDMDELFKMQRMADEMYMREAEKNPNAGFMKIPEESSDLKIDLEPVR